LRPAEISPCFKVFHEGLGSRREWDDEIDLSRHKKLCEESEVRPPAG
jgi:hypothetical protein